jgi:hypothetical protein
MPLLAACWLTTGYVHAAVIGTETFDSDAAGFVPNTTSSTVVWTGSGGNPGGHILTRKDLSPPVFDIGALTAGANFTGDYAADGINGATVDLNFMTDNVDAAWLRFRKDIFTNGWRFPLTNVFLPTDSWNTYSVAFDPTWSDADAMAAGWLTDEQIDPSANPSPPFANVMGSVGRAEVRIGSVGSTVVGIDNFGLVPEPSALSLALIACGLLVARRRNR